MKYIWNASNKSPSALHINVLSRVAQTHLFVLCGFHWMFEHPHVSSSFGWSFQFSKFSDFCVILHSLWFWCSVRCCAEHIWNVRNFLLSTVVMSCVLNLRLEINLFLLLVSFTYDYGHDDGSFESIRKFDDFEFNFNRWFMNN